MYTDKQKNAIIEVRNLFEKHNIQISCEDPYCGVEMSIAGVEVEASLKSLNKLIATFSYTEPESSKPNNQFREWIDTL